MAGLPPVVDHKYVTSHDTQLSVSRKVVNISGGDFAITSSDGTALFKLKGSMVSLREKRVLYDSADCPVLTLHKKLISIHDTWQAFKGETSETLFSVKKEHATSRGGVEAYEVFVAGSPEAAYVVKGDFPHRNYSIVFRGEAVAAEVSKKLFNLSSIFGGKNKYGVKVHAGVDTAFVAAIVVIIDSIHQEDKDAKGDGSSSDSD